jgi:uncharacterized protein YndB with AHSA1/START domain
MSENQSAQTTFKMDIVVKRIIDAPLERVWKAWTDPAEIVKWWGPQFWTSPSARVDLREGGAFVFAMQAPPEQGGMTHYTGGVFTRIVPLERIETVQYMADPNGNKIDPASVGMPPDFPAEIPTTVTFRRVRPDMTELTITEHDWPAGTMMVFSLAGLHQTVDKLIDSLA